MGAQCNEDQCTNYLTQLKKSQIDKIDHVTLHYVVQLCSAVEYDDKFGSFCYMYALLYITNYNFYQLKTVKYDRYKLNREP